MLVWECWLDGVAPPPTAFQPGNWVPTAPGYWNSINGEYTNCSSDLMLTSLESTEDVSYMLYFTFTIKVLEVLPSTAKITISDEDYSVSSIIDISSYGVGTHKVIHSIHNPMRLFDGNIIVLLSGIAPCTVTIKEILYSYDKKARTDPEDPPVEDPDLPPGGDPTITIPHIVTNTDTVSNCGGFDPDYISFCGVSKSTIALYEDDPYFSDLLLLMYMNGTEGSNTFIDSTGIHTITPEPDAFITKEVSAFDNACYNGLNGRLNTSIPLGTPEWTIDFFAYYPAYQASIYLEQYQNKITIIHAGKYLFAENNRPANYDNPFLTTSVIDFSSFIHIAIVKKDSKISVYAGGSKVGENLNANYTFDLEQICGSGNVDFGTNQGMYIDMLRVTDRARYLTNFTPPTNKYEGTWKLYHSENGVDYTKFYESVAPEPCKSVDLPLEVLGITHVKAELYNGINSAGWVSYFSDTLWNIVSSPTEWTTSTTCGDETGVPPGFEVTYSASGCELEPSSTIINLTGVQKVRVTFTLGHNGSGTAPAGQVSYSGEYNTSIADLYLPRGEYIVEFPIAVWDATSTIFVNSGTYPTLRITNIELYLGVNNEVLKYTKIVEIVPCQAACSPFSTTTWKGQYGTIWSIDGYVNPSNQVNIKSNYVLAPADSRTIEVTLVIENKEDQPFNNLYWLPNSLWTIWYADAYYTAVACQPEDSNVYLISKDALSPSDDFTFNITIERQDIAATPIISFSPDLWAESLNQLIWVEAGTTQQTTDGYLSLGEPSYIMPADGWWYTGHYGGCDDCVRAILVDFPRLATTVSFKIYSPEVSHWSHKYTLYIVGSLDTLVERAYFDDPAMPAEMLVAGTVDVVRDTSTLGEIQKIAFVYGGRDGFAGDRPFLMYDIFLLGDT